MASLKQSRSHPKSAPPRHKVLRRRWVAVLSIVTVLGLAYVMLFTGLFGVSSVRVLGTHSVSDGRVRSAASVQHGQPLVRVDTGAIRTRVDGLSAITSVDVSRSWPSTIVIRVNERTPVAVLDRGARYRLVDGSGVAFRTVAEKPKGLPELASPRGGQRKASMHAAAAVAAALPTQLRGHTVTVRAQTPHAVRLSLDDDTTVIWGSPERNARKAKVLAALMTQSGSVYDVSSPELPTIR